MAIIRRRVTLSATVAIFLLATSSSLRAADIASEPPPLTPAPAPVDSGWVFTVAPYFWAAGIEGDVGVLGRQPVNVDMSFGDIWDDLKFGGMIVGEAHNGTWGLLADVIYVKTEAGRSVERTLAGVPLELAASVEASSLTATIMGEYRAISQPQGTLDLMAGARIFSVDADIDIGLTAGGDPIAQLSGSDGDTWVDPIVGLRGRFNVTPSWYLTGWGMVGGFGASSDITWDVLGAVGYQWNDRLSLMAGYRALGVDYENDGFVYDVVEHGPILGAAFRF